MFNFATYRKNIRQYNRKVLTVPPGKHKVVFEQSYRYNSVQLWNKVKPEIRDSCSLNTFKLNYFKDYFNSVKICQEGEKLNLSQMLKEGIEFV